MTTTTGKERASFAVRSGSDDAAPEPAVRWSRFCNPSLVNLALAVLCVNLVAGQLLHEAGHWVVLSITGREPVWGLTSLVQLSDASPQRPGEWVQYVSPTGGTGWLHLGSLPESRIEWAAFLAGGPIAQLLGIAAGIGVAVLARRPRLATIGLLVALVNAFGHLLYQVVGALRGGGSDETLLAYYTGLPLPFIVAVLAGAAGIGLWTSFSRVPDAWRVKWGAALLLGILPAGPVIMRVNQVVIERVDDGHQLFRPVFGFSLPVIVLGGIALLAVLLLSRSWTASTSPGGRQAT